MGEKRSEDPLLPEKKEEFGKLVFCAAAHISFSVSYRVGKHQNATVRSDGNEKSSPRSREYYLCARSREKRNFPSVISRNDFDQRQRYVVNVSSQFSLSTRYSTHKRITINITKVPNGIVHILRGHQYLRTAGLSPLLERESAW